MQPKTDERREFQRLNLDEPVSGQFATAAVAILEVGVLGAQVRHAIPLPARGELQFVSDGDAITMRCEVVRTLQAPGENDSEDSLVSGLRFLAAVGESGDALRAMLSRLVGHAIATRHDASMTKLRLRNVDGDKTVRGLDAQFRSFRYENGTWRRRHVFLPEQPASGFTVARGEDPQEMERLCIVYEASDEEGRRLIRLFAELSVSDVLQIPPRT